MVFSPFLSPLHSSESLPKFEVFNTAIEKDHSWIQDISPIISGEVRLSSVIREYCEKNPELNHEKVEDALENLKSIVQKQIGLIELESDLDIETVTEIFIRINSKGVVLSQADFAMSKMASNEIYGGSMLRKCIDYFCHMAVSPEFYNHLADVDHEFHGTEHFQKISWLKNETDDLYDPEYTDLLRVAFTSEFNRGKISDLVSLLSGRNFETRTFEESIVENTFERLGKGITNAVNETNFKRFLMIIRSAGFISPDMVRSQNVLNYAYILYLKLKGLGYKASDIEQYVRKWFVFSILSGRYSGSPESMIDFDIRQVAEKPFEEILKNIEEAQLSDAFWNSALIQDLEKSSISSPAFNVFLASQVKGNDKGFLSRDITVNDLISLKGDIHHIFPKDYLKKNGYTKTLYNQVANYVYMQTEINIRINNKAPEVYFKELIEQCSGGDKNHGGIISLDELRENMRMNCIPESVLEMSSKNYEDFLVERRYLMSQKIKNYYFNL